MTALLLAEPEPSVRGFLERQLRNDGFDVVACERAEQLPRAAEPDVLVLGDAAALGCSVVPDCPVIVLGGADPAARVQALAHADDCLAKPFVYEELLAIISHSAQTQFRLHAGLLCRFGVSATPLKSPNDTGKKRKSVNCPQREGAIGRTKAIQPLRMCLNVQEAGSRLSCTVSVRERRLGG